LRLKRDTAFEVIQESVKRKPLVITGNVSVPAAGSATLKIDIPKDELWFIKSWAITKGANTTITSVTIDGEDTSKKDSLADTVPEYGALLTAELNISVAGSNAGSAAENLDVVIKGYKLE
jgi:hypothetical protein